VRERVHQTPEKRDVVKDTQVITDKALSAKLQTGRRMQIVLGATGGTCLVLLASLGSMRMDEWLNRALFALTIGLACSVVAFYSSTMRYEESNDPWVQGFAASKALVFKLVAENAALLITGWGVMQYLGHFDPQAGTIFGGIIVGSVVAWVAIGFVFGAVEFVRQRPK
jgi:hypothetical protein